MSFWRLSLARAVILVLQAAATRGLGVASSALLARLLTPSDWGSLQAVNSVAMTMTQTLKLSLDGGLQIRLSETEAHSGGPSHGELLGAGLLGIGLVALVAIVAGAGFGDLTARLFGDPALVPFMAVGGLLAAGQLVAQVGVVLLSFGAFKTYAAINTWVALGYVALLAIAYVIGVGGLPLGVGALGAMHVGTGGLMLVFALRSWRARGIRVRLTRMREATAELLRLGLPLYLGASVPSLVTLFVTADLARASGISALATLRVVGSLNQLVAFVPAAFAQTFVTQFAGMRGGASQIPSRDFLRYLRLIVAGGVLSAVATAIVAPWIVPLIFGPDYVPAARLVSIGVMSALLLTTKQAVLVGLIAERRTSFSLLDSLLVSVGYAGLSALLIAPLGVTGLLLADCGSQLLSLAIMGIVVGRRFVQPGIGGEAAKTLLSMLLALALLAASYLLFDSPLRLLWAASWLALAAGMVPALLLRRDERAALVGIARRALARLGTRHAR